MGARTPRAPDPATRLLSPQTAVKHDTGSSRHVRERWRRLPATDDLERVLRMQTHDSASNGSHSTSHSKSLHKEIMNMLSPKRLAVAGMVAGLMACAPDERADAEAAMAEAGNEVSAAIDEMQADVRSAMDEVSQDIRNLDTEYAEASEEARMEWDEAQTEIQQYRQDLDAKLSNLEQASEEEARELRIGIAEDLRELRLRTERARLRAAEGTEDFVMSARTSLTELDGEMQELSQEMEALGAEARMEASEALSEFQTESRELKERLDALANEASEEVAEERDDLAEAIAELSASVREELFKAEQQLESAY